MGARALIIKPTTIPRLSMASLNKQSLQLHTQPGWLYILLAHINRAMNKDNSERVLAIL